MLEVMEVGEVGGWVCTCRVVAIADVARLGGPGDARLSAVVIGLVPGAARVGRLDGHVERRVDERRVAALSPPGGVVARPQSRPTATPARLRGGPRRHECHGHGEDYNHNSTTLRHLQCQRDSRPQRTARIGDLLPVKSSQPLASIHDTTLFLVI